MLIKVFTKNANNKIELSEKELKDLLDEAYWDGYYSTQHGITYTYTSPKLRWEPYVFTNNTSSECTINSNTTITNDSTIGTDLRMTFDGDH